MNTRDNYIPPIIEVVEVYVERGFGESNNGGNGGMSAPSWG